MIKLFSLLKRGRLRKKSMLYKQVWQMTFDPVIIFYIAILMSYISWAILQSDSISLTISQLSFQMEAISIHVLWIVMTALPLGLIFRSFTRPGIIISTAEYRASILPYTKGQIWWMAAGFLWLRLTILLSVIGLVIYFASPTSGKLVLIYICLILLINILMTSMEWRLFQLHIIWKIFVFIIAISVNVFSILTNSTLVGPLSLLGLFILNGLLLPKITEKVDWDKVTAACDYQVWNMAWMTYFTKQKMKKERAYTLWQRMPFWRKDFQYKDAAIYGRLWFVYWQRQFVLLLRFLGTILLLVSFIPLLNMWIIDMMAVFGIEVLPVKDWFFYLALIIGMHMYVTVSVALWRDRLTTDLMQVLPWNLRSLHTTFLKWANPGLAIFLLPIYLYSLEHLSWLFIIQMVIALFAVHFLLYWKIAEAFQLISEKETCVVPKVILRLSYSLYIIIVVSAFIPYMIIVGIIVFIIASTYHIRMKQHIY